MHMKWYGRTNPHIAMHCMRSVGCFTLVELMILIAIFAVMGALLLPALQKVIETGRRAACANNQKQIYLGAANYADNYHGFLPVVSVYPFQISPIAHTAQEFIREYLDEPCIPAAWMPTLQMGRKDNLLRCPSRAAIFTCDVLPYKWQYELCYTQYLFCGFSQYDNGKTKKDHLYMRLPKVGRGGPLGPVALLDDAVCGLVNSFAAYNANAARNNNHSQSYPSGIPEGGNVLLGSGGVKWFSPAERRAPTDAGMMRPKSTYQFMWYYSASPQYVDFVGPAGHLTVSEIIHLFG